jgi:hypothetical protein
LETIFGLKTLKHVAICFPQTSDFLETVTVYTHIFGNKFTKKLIIKILNKEKGGNRRPKAQGYCAAKKIAI